MRSSSWRVCWRKPKDLWPFVKTVTSESEWRHGVETALMELQRKGYVAESMQLSDAGEKHVLECLGLKKRPPLCRWDVIKRRYLLPRALGLPPGSPKVQQRLKDSRGGGLRGALLQRYFGLPVAETATELQAVDALVRRQLGMDGTGVLSLNAVRSAVLAPLVGGGSPDLKRIKRLLSAQASGARNTDAAEISTSIVGCWATGQNRTDLQDFCRRVLGIAKSAPRFGNSKAFIGPVWQRLRSLPQYRHLAREDFDRRLAEANRLGLLGLSRADLVGAMDPDLVRESEVSFLNATFHFIDLEAESQP
ncbi:hypothetical protein ACFL59_14590 [Planctomycetota bacterium]